METKQPCCHCEKLTGTTIITDDFKKISVCESCYDIRERPKTKDVMDGKISLVLKYIFEEKLEKHIENSQQHILDKFMHPDFREAMEISTKKYAENIRK